MKKNIIIASVFTLLGSSAIAGDVTTTFKASANIEATCNIGAENINFGVVALPLTAQSASGDLRILCSKSTSYKIDLKYGGVYGTGKVGDGNNYDVRLYTYSDGGLDDYLSVTKNGTEIGKITCLSGNRIKASTTTVGQMIGISTTAINDVNGYCADKISLRNRVVEYGTGVKYSYGIMNGALKADKLAYKITIPNDVTKVWNNGINSYRSTGTGAEEIIVMNAQIVPGSSSSNYVAADSYLDTVTATVTY